MLTLVQIPRSKQSSVAATSLVAAYLAFDQQRLYRRQFMKAFVGLALVVLGGGAFGFLARPDAAIAAAMLMAPPAVLAVLEAVHWRRLVRRLDDIRVSVRSETA